MSPLIELYTTTMAPSGEAVAHHQIEGQRRAVLVRGALPDETVRTQLDPSARPIRAEIVELVTRSAQRVDAPCRYAASCGGCDWMHMSRQAQRAHHVTLADKVARGVRVAFHDAPYPLGHRVRGRVHLQEERGGMRVGFFGPRSRDLVCVETCMMLDPRIDAARADLETLFDGAHGHGEVSIALGKALPVGEARWSRELPASVFARLDGAVHAGWAGFRVWCGESKRPAVFGDPTPWLVGADGLPLEIAPGGFSQPQTEVNAAMTARVAELVGGGHHVVELYAGAGNFTVMLARTSADVRAVEASEAACGAARRNLAARGLTARVTSADATSFEVPKATDGVVLDPPRTGARDVCARLASRSKVERIVYVSCDRVTLARDLDLLEPRYAVTSVDVFEMFPHTSHAETVVALKRRRS